MSWLRCDSCDALIDTNENPGAYNERQDQWLCVDCQPSLLAPVADDPGEIEQMIREKNRGPWERLLHSGRRRRHHRFGMKVWGRE